MIELWNLLGLLGIVVFWIFMPVVGITFGVFLMARKVYNIPDAVLPVPPVLKGLGHLGHRVMFGSVRGVAALLARSKRGVVFKLVRRVGRMWAFWVERGGVPAGERGWLVVAAPGPVLESLAPTREALRILRTLGYSRDRWPGFINPQGIARFVNDCFDENSGGYRQHPSGSFLPTIFATHEALVIAKELAGDGGRPTRLEGDLVAVKSSAHISQVVHFVESLRDKDTGLFKDNTKERWEPNVLSTHAAYRILHHLGSPAVPRAGEFLDLLRAHGCLVEYKEDNRAGFSSRGKGEPTLCSTFYALAALRSMLGEDRDVGAWLESRGLRGSIRRFVESHWVDSNEMGGFAGKSSGRRRGTIANTYFGLTALMVFLNLPATEVFKKFNPQKVFKLIRSHSAEPGFSFQIGLIINIPYMHSTFHALRIISLLPGKFKDRLSEKKLSRQLVEECFRRGSVATGYPPKLRI